MWFRYVAAVVFVSVGELFVKLAIWFAGDGYFEVELGNRDFSMGRVIR
jgi:hypothetical protein